MGLRRVFTALLCSAIAAQAVALCGATGWSVFTSYPSAELDRQNAGAGLSGLFENTGLNERHGSMGLVESRFAFGWLPSALWGPEALSVATLGGPGALAALIALWPLRGRPQR
jgi:hypothetical protein